MIWSPRRASVEVNISLGGTIPPVIGGLSPGRAVLYVGPMKLIGPGNHQIQWGIVHPAVI
jgi:hypothetical protein